MRFHCPFFLEDSYRQRDEVNRNAYKQSKPCLADYRDGYEFRNNIQEIIGVAKISEEE